jgi:membrane fusion protein, multidrug efflux system
MQKKTYLFLILTGIMLIFAATFFYSKRQASVVTAENVQTEKVIDVTTRKVAESQKLIENLVYPAVTVGDQEVTVTAQASGTITEINFDLGSKVTAGLKLATIDNLGNFSNLGQNDLKSSSIRALELAVESAEQSYKKAKDEYEENDSYANKKEKEIASLDLKIAKANLDGALDTHFIVAPINGIITERLVASGDSVSSGQTIAKISQTGLTKIQFYVDKEEIGKFKYGTALIINDDETKIAGSVMRVSPQADVETRRFLVEAKPTAKTTLLIGKIISVSVGIERVSSSAENIILPLSAIAIGQNESYIFTAENSKAQKQIVQVLKVLGESAEVKTNLPADAQIIIEGSKLVKDGKEIKIINN